MSESAKAGQKLKILVVRPDKIGDVVLSTPVLEALKKHNSNSEIHLLVRDSVAPVVEHSPYVSKILHYRPGSLHKGTGGALKLAGEIRKERYDIAVVLQVNFQVSVAVLASGIRYRVGPYSKWYSFLFFNRGKRQNRSAVEMHEADYNLMLLRRLGIRVPSRKYEPNITVDADAKERMRKFVRAEGLAEQQPFVVIHPGMGGSALNWPEGYYVELLQRIASRGVHVFVTGSIGEKRLVERVVASAKEHKSDLPIHSFLGPNSPSGLADMIALLSLAQVVVAPSTGPLHIATALGKRTVSFYPPVKVQSALRWGPYGSDESKHSVLVPDALCGQDFKCAGKKCHFYFCMERLSVEEALQNVMLQLENATK